MHCCFRPRHPVVFPHRPPAHSTHPTTTMPAFSDLQIADLTFVLTQPEIDNKLTMLCMCRPVSDVVYVETQVLICRGDALQGRRLLKRIGRVMGGRERQGRHGPRLPVACYSPLQLVLAQPQAIKITHSTPLQPQPTHPCTQTYSLQSNWGYNLGSNDWQGPTGYISGKSVDPLMGRRWEELQNEAAEQAIKDAQKHQQNAEANAAAAAAQKQKD